MEAALRDAARLGITVFAASGDNLATDRVGDGLAHVDYPGSSPYVVGCGGTRLAFNGAGISVETVWNASGRGTGGGISEIFELPPYQTGAQVPRWSITVIAAAACRTSPAPPIRPAAIAS